MIKLPSFLRPLVPKPVRRAILRATRRPRVGRVDLGDLRRTTPISRDYGGDRGQPIDRYYIAAFLARYRDDVAGVVLEAGDTTYTRRLGGDRVKRAMVLAAPGDRTPADFYCDLASGEGLPEETYDCIVLLQTLHLVSDLKPAVTVLHQSLRPGGVLLATLPGFSQLENQWPDHWRFTPHSARWLFERCFAPASIECHSFGNVYSTVAFLHGLSLEDVDETALDAQDGQYPLILGVRAVKQEVAPSI